MDRLTAPSIAVPPSPTFPERGFTLTEMAVVLAIVALLIGGMIMPMSAQQDIKYVAETEATLKNLQEALLGFVVANGRLPRPATSATDGSERQAACATDAECAGFIPWATLGVGRVDAWGKLVRYSVTPAFANNTISLSTLPNRTIQTRDAAGNLAYLVGVDDLPSGAPDGVPDCTSATRCTPAVIFSHGKGRWGTTDTGVVLSDGSATNIDEDANQNGSTNYFSRTHSSATTGGGEFDDIVVWLPSSILINRMISAGKLP